MLISPATCVLSKLSNARIVVLHDFTGVCSCRETRPPTQTAAPASTWRQLQLYRRLSVRREGNLLLQVSLAKVSCGYSSDTTLDADASVHLEQANMAYRMTGQTGSLCYMAPEVTSLTMKCCQ